MSNACRQAISIGALLFAFLISGCAHRLTPEEAAKTDEQMAKCREAIKAWIIAHAQHPETYVPGAFDEYAFSRTMNGDQPEPNSETYEMRHTHQLRALSGEMKEYSGYFILDNEFNVGIVETQRSNAIGAGSDPDWKDWTDLFGRPMTKEDSIPFRERASRSIRKEMESFREKMDAGEAYVEGMESDSAKALVDSLIHMMPK